MTYSRPLLRASYEVILLHPSKIWKNVRLTWESNSGPSARESSTLPHRREHYVVVVAVVVVVKSQKKNYFGGSWRERPMNYLILPR